jgi:hypothetical protein
MIAEHDIHPHKPLDNNIAGNELQAEVKYICVNFVVDDDEMVPFPDYFDDIQDLLHADLLYSPEVLQGNRSIYTIVRNIIAWYVVKAPPLWAIRSGRNMQRTKERVHRLFGPLQLPLRHRQARHPHDASESRAFNHERTRKCKEVARELEINFDDNGGIVTPAIHRIQTRNNSFSSTPPILVARINATNSKQEPIVATTEVTAGETTSPVDEMVATENHALALPPLNSFYNSGSIKDYHNSGPNRANDRNGNAFANNA